ncbi:MAG TPA: hypothetical protein VKE74_10395 [Gemmataceae bacterium]|nr:hypothetical protein [Gemmataceae bacterium]
MRTFLIATALAVGVLALHERAAAQYIMQPGDISGPGWYYSPQYGVMRNPFNPPPPFSSPYRQIAPPTVIYSNGYGPGLYGGGMNGPSIYDPNRPRGWRLRDPYSYPQRW